MRGRLALEGGGVPGGRGGGGACSLCSKVEADKGEERQQKGLAAVTKTSPLFSPDFGRVELQDDATREACNLLMPFLSSAGWVVVARLEVA
ncbi:hypothetical protein RJ55_00721 [Drechmeria coniospora]|nr:hypothetical protein RJ55_00721 [Drechmeria coniospora]